MLHRLYGTPIAPILFVFLLGSTSLLYPFGRDQGEYAAIAMEVSGGRVPYREVFNVKPPLTHMVHGLALAFFGQSMMAIRWLDLIWQGLTAVALALLVERIFGNHLMSMFAALLYVMWYYSFDYWHTAQTDGFLTLPTLITLLAYSYYLSHRRLGFAFVSGFFIGIAVLFKYPIGILLPFLLILSLVPHLANGRKAAVVLMIGFIVPVAAFLLFLVTQGALGDFLFIQHGYVTAYNARGGGPLGLLQLLLAKPVMLLLCCSAILFEVMRWRRWPKRAVLVSVWWLAAFVHLVVQNKFYLYHGLPLLAPGAVMFSSLIVVILERTRFAQSFSTAPIVALLALVLTMSAMVGQSTRVMTSIDVLTGDLPLEQVYAGFGDYGSGDYSVRADMEVADYLRSHTDESDTLFIWGFEPTVYFLAGRSSASRFLYNYPLYGDFGWQQLRDQLVNELEQKKPLYIVVVQNDAIPWVTGTGDDSLTAFLGFPELRRLVDSGYALEAQIEDFYVYRRRSEWPK